MSVLFYDGVDHMIEKITTLIKGKANNSHKHGNGDITSLDAGKITSGTISIDRLPQGALERLTIVADDTARFKLTSSNVQKGDTVKVISTGKMYYIVDETKLSSEDGYEVYAAGTAASVPWSGVTGKPSTYTPSSHTHTKSEVGLGNVDNTSDANKNVKSSKKLQTYKLGSTTETYGDNYPIYAQWRDASHVRLKCDNNTVETDYATSAGSADAVVWSNVSSKPAMPESGDYSSDNIEALLKKIMGLTPRMGSTCFTKDTRVGNTWWNFFYIPHRDGVGGDNGEYGTLLLFPMVGNGLSYIVRAGKGGVIASISSIITSSNISSQSVESAVRVNGHTVESNVPANAKFTDTDTWRPQPDWNATSGDAMILNKPSIISAEPIEIESETSLNDVVDTGTYYCNYNKTYTNMPPSISNGWLCVSKVSDTIVKQVFLRHGTANTNDYQIYVRTKIGTTWSDWTKVVTSKDYATTSDYGAIKLSTSVSNTSTALAATPSAVKIAYDKAVSAFSGKGLPYAIFDIASDATTSAAWTETALQLKLQKSGAGDRVGSFRHGGSNFIYCPFSGIVDIDVNVFATAATNGYYYARCYKYNTSGDDELLDFAGLGGYTAAGCQGSGSMKVHVTAGTYIYINVTASTVIKASASNSHIRVQYTMID